MKNKVVYTFQFMYANEISGINTKSNLLVLVDTLTPSANLISQEASESLHQEQNSLHKIIPQSPVSVC